MNPEGFFFFFLPPSRLKMLSLRYNLIISFCPKTFHLLTKRSSKSSHWTLEPANVWRIWFVLVWSGSESLSPAHPSIVSGCTYCLLACREGRGRDSWASPLVLPPFTPLLLARRYAQTSPTTRSQRRTPGSHLGTKWPPCMRSRACQAAET